MGTVAAFDHPVCVGSNRAGERLDPDVAVGGFLALAVGLAEDTTCLHTIDAMGNRRDFLVSEGVPAVGPVGARTSPRWRG
jgi:hypothetical protein